MKHWIVNASPLILLGKIGRLDLIGVLVPSYSVPESVSREILAGPTNDPARRWIMADGGKSVVPDVKIPAEVLAWDLGDGETAVISMALTSKEPLCVLDDLAARNCAAAFQIPLIGTLGLLLKAKMADLIPALKPEIDRLLSVGSMLSDRVIEEALDLAGE